MADPQALKVYIATPEDYHTMPGTVLDRIPYIVPKGLYEESSNLIYRSDLGYVTLQHGFSYGNRGPTAWVPHQLRSLTSDPITGESMTVLATEDIALEGDLSVCKPDLFSQIISESSNTLYDAVHVPRTGVIATKELMDANQPFVVFAWCHQVPLSLTANPLPFLRILWGSVPPVVAEDSATTYGGSSAHPFHAAQWAIDLTTGDQLDRVCIHGYEPRDPLDPMSQESLWRVQSYCQVLPPSGAGSRARTPIALMIEPRPPVSINITDLYSGRSIQVTAWDLPTVEAAWEQEVDYAFYGQGRVSVCFKGAGVAYFAPVVYPASGYLIGRKLNIGKAVEEEDEIPKVYPNISNAITNPGETNHLKGQIPGTTTQGTDVTTTIVEVDSPYAALTSGALPVDEFRYKVELTGNLKRTPFLGMVALTGLPYDSPLVSERLDASEDVIELRIRKSLDDRRRTGTAVLRNTDGKYNHLLRTDAAPVFIYLDDTMIYRGYVSHATEEVLGPHSTATTEYDYKPADYPANIGTGGDLTQYTRAHQRHLTIQLEDRWKRLDYNLLSAYSSFALDGKFHNVGLWYLMRYKARLDHSEIDMPMDGTVPKIVTTANQEPGYYGVSTLLLTDYEATSPTWMPEMCESMSSFVQRIHDAKGGYWWEMFFDDEGKFYYQPQYSRRFVDENKATFVERTRDTVDDPTKFPIIGKLTTDLDYEEYRNEFVVSGMMRKWQEVYGTAPPIANDPAYEAALIGVRLAFPQSWEDPDYEWYVGERRTRWIVNTGLNTYEQCAQAAWWLAYKFGVPRRVFRFTSYRVPGVRPGNWGTLESKGETYTIRFRTIDEVFDQRLGGSDPRYYSSGEMVNGWLANYEVDLVYPWEEW